MSYEPGIARITDPLGSSPVVDYYHANHLGTTRNTTDGAGGFTQVRAKTAFGEPLTGQHDRYGYVGTFGYQAHTEFPYLHVGARYYDPASGRFLQRDPIGIDGGLNVYEYVRSRPTVGVDPEGELIATVVVTAVAIAVKTATGYYRAKAAAEEAEARKPNDTRTTDQVIDDLNNRRRRFKRARPSFECIITYTPGTSLTGSPLPARSVAWGAVQGQRA